MSFSAPRVRNRILLPLALASLFTALAGPAAGQVQLQWLTDPAAPADENQFGKHVAATPDGSWMVVGGGTGQVHVYRFESTAYVLHQILTAPNPPYTYYGYYNSVAISDDGAVVAVASPGVGVNSVSIFRRVGDTWTMDTPWLAVYGFAVSLSADGNVLAVGAAAVLGSVHIFRHDGSAWIHEWSASATGASGAEELGYSVDLDAAGERLIAGAPRTGDVGAVRVYAYDGATWFEQAQITNPDPLGGERFGETVALDGDTAVVCTYNDANFNFLVGAAHVFEWNGGAWSPVQKLAPTPAVCDVQCVYGIDVDLRGDQLLVLSENVTFADWGTPTEAAFLYRRGYPGAGEPLWVFVTRLFVDQRLGNHVGGWRGSCALAGPRAIVGAPGERMYPDEINGAVRVYEINECLENGVVAGADPALAWEPFGCGTVAADGDGLVLTAGAGCSLVGAMVDRRDLVLCRDFDVSVGWCMEEWPLPVAPGARRGVYLAVNGANNGDHENTLAAIGRVDHYTDNYACFDTGAGQFLGWYDTFRWLRYDPSFPPDTCSMTLATEPRPTMATSGGFRITRSGATITLYYREGAGGSWIELTSRDVDDTAVSIQVWADSFRTTGAYPDPTPFTVRFGTPQSPCAPSDTEPPVVTITAPADESVTAAGSVTLAADVADESATTVSSTPAGVTPGGLPAGGGSVAGPVPLAAQGANVLTVNAVDVHGNPGGSSVTVYRDSIAPVLGVAPAEGTVLGMGPVELHAAVLDQTETGVTVDGAPAGTLAVAGGAIHGVVDGSLTSSRALAEGLNGFTVTATDAAGNSTTVLRTVVLDSSAPVVTIDDPLNGAVLDSTPVPLVATIDDLTEVTVSGDLTAVVPAGGGVVAGTASLLEGWNELAVTGTDAAGNSAAATVSVLLDTTPPTVAVVSPLDGSLVKGSIDFHAVADDPSPGSGVATVELLVDGAPYALFATGPYEVVLDTTLLPDGWHTLAAVATDGVGHAAQHQVSIRVDNTPPIVSITDPAAGSLLAGEIAFSALAQDDESGLVAVQMRSGGGVPSVADGSTTYGAPTFSDLRMSVDTAPTEDGAWTLSARAVDAAGNEATAEITVFTDNSAPERAILSPADGAVVSGVVPIEVAVADPNLDHFELFVGGVLVISDTGTGLVYLYDTSARPDGPMSIAVTAYDTLGNVSTSSITVTVGNTGGCVEIHPETLNLKSKGKDKSITVEVCGYGLEALLPTEGANLRLCVPGGSPVPSTANFSGDDQVHDDDGDGFGRLLLKFDRQLLIASIRAGRQSGAIVGNQVVLTLKAGALVLGTDEMKLVGE